MIITIAVPAAHIADANQLAMILGYGPADELTYREPQWQDAAGNLYAAASPLVGDNFIANAQATLTRPGWDVEPYAINMAGANRAQALVVLWLAGSETAAPLAANEAITAIGGMDGLAALALMGLVSVVQDLG
ncbi:hypothetical protein [Cypionkella sp.]|uniref:hypothetical protein n=1 Tax=Cypionkella sp. TaxID=2811411 RepID=UPI0027167916|nr:hypothetical protein [Cypionkella sp.]MDO8983006.1 hypothetical protein [Cypionkella sp.]MDP2047549.1 hypothetical protein [Cypionkella sp.]